MNETESLTLFSNLPEELIPQILLRLPVRSLVRFKCVCKSWLSLISDPEFGKSHFDLAATAPTHRYLVRKINNSPEIESIDIDASLQVFIKFTFWVPAEGFERRIGDGLGNATLDFLNGFGYDPSRDDYLKVCLRLIDNEYLLEQIDDDLCHISYFSLRENSWNDVDDPQSDVQYVDIGTFDSRVGSFLNQALHWLVLSFETKLHVIIAFDLVERSLSEVPLTLNLAEKLAYYQFFLREQYLLRVMGECLSLCFPGNMASKAEIWMMKKYGVQSSWTKLFAVSTCDIPRSVFFPKCFTKHHGVFGSNGSRRLMVLSDKGLLLAECTLFAEPNKYQYMQVGCGMYSESLLSLPNDFEKAIVNDKLTTSSLEEASEDENLTSSSVEASEDDQ